MPVSKTGEKTDFAHYNVNNANDGSIVFGCLLNEVLEREVCLVFLAPKKPLDVLLMRD